MFPQPLAVIPIARGICTDTETVAQIKETIVEHLDVTIRLFRVRKQQPWSGRKMIAPHSSLKSLHQIIIPNRDIELLFTDSRNYIENQLNNLITLVWKYSRTRTRDFVYFYLAGGN